MHGPIYIRYQLDLLVMRFIRIELIMCSTSKVDRVKVHIQVVCDVMSYKQSALSLKCINMVVHFM